MNKKLYGAWISKDKIIPVVGYECHDDVALEIVRKIFNRKEGHDFSNKYSVYRILLRLGYIRAKYSYSQDGTECFIDIVNYYPYSKFTEFQKDIIKQAIYKDFTHLYGRQMEEIMKLNK